MTTNNFINVKKTKPANILACILSFCIQYDINRGVYGNKYIDYIMNSVVSEDELKAVGVEYVGNRNEVLSSLGQGAFLVPGVNYEAQMANHNIKENIMYNKLKGYGIGYDLNGRKATSSSKIICGVLNYAIWTCAFANQFESYKDFIDWFYSEVGFTYKDLKEIGIW